MNYEFEQSPLSKGILIGLFAGIIATCLCLLYDVVFRLMTSFTLSELINVSSIIFMTNLILLVFGILYFAMKKAFRYGAVVCIAAYVLLSAYTIMKAGEVQRSADLQQTAEFRTLLTGILLIIGVCSFFLIPFLYNNKWFNKHVV